MIVLLLLSSIVVSTGANNAEIAVSAGIDYAEYDRLTRTYINQRGLVDYRGLKRELHRLRGFVDQISAISPDNRPELFPDDGERLRYYMTAYNAWVLYIAASDYPSKNSLWRFGFFRNRDIKLGGRDTSLSDLEHGIIRKRFQDPRIHFYINCAAVSCPALERGVIPSGQTGKALESSARSFINDPANVRYDPAAKRLYLSKIFDWFSGDFLTFLRAKRGIKEPHISQYVLLYLSEPARAALAAVPLHELAVHYLRYDKTLNEQK